jgi:predicted signal transduction protein with EAL and GGDEF domain
MRELEKNILMKEDLLKEKIGALMNNLGKLIAVMAALVAFLVTFTDVTLSAVGIKTLIPSLIVLIVCSYVIYFSMEDAGEELGRSTKEYTSCEARYDSLRNEIKGSDLDDLRSFLTEYSKSEANYRKEGLMLTLGVTEDDINDYKMGKLKGKKKKNCKTKFIFWKKKKRMRLPRRNMKKRAKNSKRSAKKRPF